MRKIKETRSIEKGSLGNGDAKMDPGDCLELVFLAICVDVEDNVDSDSVQPERQG